MSTKQAPSAQVAAPKLDRARHYRTAATALFFLSAACSDSGAPDKKLLSERGLYSDIASRRPVAEALEFEPDYPLWSDGVQKRRWLILPQGERIDTSEMDHWDLPVGAKLFKEFALHGQLLETRLVERVKDSGKPDKDYVLATFVWREDQTDAVETTDGVQDIFGTDHNVPPQKVCQDCHRGERGRALGVSALQLSRSGLLQTLAERSLLSVDPKRTYLIPGDEVESAAAGYMHANCGHCHSAEGQAPGSMHLRFSVNEVDNPIDQSELYETTIHQKISEWKDHPEQFTERVVPGDPEHSSIYYRMKQRGDEMPAPDQMPPLATEKVHLEGVAAVKAWIELLKDKPPAAEPERKTHDDMPVAMHGAAGAGGAMAPGKPASEAGKSGSDTQGRPEANGSKPSGTSSTPSAPSNMGDVPAEPINAAGAQAPATETPGAGGSGGVGGGASPAAGSGGAGAVAPPPTTSSDPSTPGEGQAGQGSVNSASTGNPAGQGGAGGEGGVGGTPGGAGCGGEGGKPAPDPRDPDGDGDIDYPRHSGHAGQRAPH